MKTLTYGTLPNYTEFKAAFNKNGDGEAYEIIVRDGSIDKDMLSALELWRSEQIVFVSDKGVGRFEAQFKYNELYDLCEALCELWGNEAAFMRDSEQCNWAGDFCSSILSTLGYEWV